MTPAELKARKRRSMWIALAIAGFIVLVFLITLAKMQAGLSQ